MQRGEFCPLLPAFSPWLVRGEHGVSPRVTSGSPQGDFWGEDLGGVDMAFSFYCSFI